MTYKFQLDKSSKKFACPNCQKKTFVKYLDIETNQYLEAHIGRCDRESKCNYHQSPKGNIPSVNFTENIKVVTPSFHNDAVIGDFSNDYMNNNFIKYLLKHFSRVDIIEAIKKYFIGTSNKWQGATVFWQVDEFMNICAGKVMLYDKNTGKRVKNPYPHINWMHKFLKLDGFRLQQCLFGLHNLYDSEINIIAIVESEKTAIIMSVFCPDMTWMATGAKSNFRASLLEPLRGRKIIAYPDKTEFQDWNKKAEKLREEGFCILCSSFLEGRNLEDGSDLVDLLLDLE